MKLLSSLVRIESVSGNEKNLAVFVMKHLTSIGLQPFFQGENVVVHIEGKQRNNAVIFNAHMDTVSAGSLSSWHYPPVGKDAGVCIDNKLYGLGASDDKAGVASLLLLAKELAEQQPASDVWLTFVVKEETDGSGTRSFIQWFKDEGWLKKYQSISGIICEPTDLEEIKIGHRGNIFVKVTVHGDGGHGARPHLVKINAIEETYKVIQKLKTVDSLWAEQYRHPVLGQPSLAVTTISGGDPSSPNKFADSCALTLDIRTTPRLHHQTLSLLKQELSEFKASLEIPYQPASFGNTDPDAAIVKKAKKLTKAKLTINVATNDLCFFTEVNIPGIIFGPGANTTIHKPNEYCEVADVQKAAEIYRQLI
jgi:acetylornithine deacetylase/succinyl-diaminopimelate desuccinylase-like protein